MIASGSDNQLSKIVDQVSGVASITSTLQKDITRFVIIITVAAVTVTLVVILEWIFYLNVEHNGYLSLGLMLSNAIGVLVAFVPEGLPLALSMGWVCVWCSSCYMYWCVWSSVCLSVCGYVCMSTYAKDICVPIILLVLSLFTVL